MNRGRETTVLLGLVLTVLAAACGNHDSDSDEPDARQGSCPICPGCGADAALDARTASDAQAAPDAQPAPDAQAAPDADSGIDGTGVRDVTYFLRRLRTLQHLPELEDAHTAMYSTWDRSGDNEDGEDFKYIDGDRNILLDVDGPGCVPRIVTGLLGQYVEGTRIEIYLDGDPEPVFDMPVAEFFSEYEGPFPYPLTFVFPSPVTLMPIPFADHILIQLVSEQEAKNWGMYWQVTYTIYQQETEVVTLSWPLTESENAELEKVIEAWLLAPWIQPDFPEPPSVRENWRLDPGAEADLALQGCGIIEHMRMSVDPPTPEVLRALWLQIHWDGAAEPSVDVPVGYFFGNGDYGDDTGARFSSMPLGVSDTYAFARFPMPFADGAHFVLENRSPVEVQALQLQLQIARCQTLPANWGRFHVTWNARPAALPDAETEGPMDIPVHVVLDRQARGKYVGVMLNIDWPHMDWWGEGDWMFWTDEEGWPPSYHGTGTEEYFNGGWTLFDRRAISGFIKMRPDPVGVYSFHLNDAFQFQRRIRVVEETVGLDLGDYILQDTNPVWRSTAYWYALPAQGGAPVTGLPAANP